MMETCHMALRGQPHSDMSGTHCSAPRLAMSYPNGHDFPAPDSGDGLGCGERHGQRQRLVKLLDWALHSYNFPAPHQ